MHSQGQSCLLKRPDNGLLTENAGQQQPLLLTVVASSMCVTAHDMVFNRGLASCHD